ncbi:MAG: DUF433 domain-containing protein [Acidobacteria bacterium]|nr:DUF433 domain-containing protein [Acidobacteriota bacterium]
MLANTQSVFDTPAYGCTQAAHYIGLPPATLRGWIGEGGLISTPQPGILSFNNLAEAHILRAMRKIHGLSHQKIRRSLQELAAIRKQAHPLLEESFETDGISLFVRDDDNLVNLSKAGQTEFRELIALYLRRIERNSAGQVTRLYPFVVSDVESEPKSISISPTIAFGRPVLVGTGISTAVIVGRFNARDSIADLASEYQVDAAILEDAIRWEMNKAA